MIGAFILAILHGTAEWLQERSGRFLTHMPWLDKAPWWVKALLAIGFMVFLVMLTFVILHFVLGPDANGNSRVF